MDDKEKENEKKKVLQFKSKNTPLTPERMLRNALEEARAFPDQVKHAFVILFDKDMEPTFWGTHLSKQQYCKALCDFQLHTMHVLSDVVQQET